MGSGDVCKTVACFLRLFCDHSPTNCTHLEEPENAITNRRTVLWYLGVNWTVYVHS